VTGQERRETMGDLVEDEEERTERLYHSHDHAHAFNGDVADMWCTICGTVTDYCKALNHELTDESEHAWGASAPKVISDPEGPEGPDARCEECGNVCIWDGFRGQYVHLGSEEG
jgi:hypothetical protein